jgi:hypothetical protein
MSPIKYIQIIIICLPVFIALDKRSLKLAFGLWLILMFPLLLAALLPEVKWISGLQWIFSTAELYWLMSTSTKVVHPKQNEGH